jgi:hypothetical protein
MKALLLIPLLLIAGCVSVPIPPFGENVGNMGDLKISIAVKYVPKFAQTTSSPELDWAWNELNKSRTIKDK